jgi:hypothetical protein
LTKAVQAYIVIWYGSGYLLKLWIYAISLSIKQGIPPFRAVTATASGIVLGKTPFSKAFSYINFQGVLE